MSIPDRRAPCEKRTLSDCRYSCDWMACKHVGEATRHAWAGTKCTLAPKRPPGDEWEEYEEPLYDPMRAEVRSMVREFYDPE